MSWELAVNGKSVGVQIGTNLGFCEMARYCEKKGGPECRAFFIDGLSRRPQQLRRELLEVLSNNKVKPDIAACVHALIDGLKRRRSATQ